MYVVSKSENIVDWLYVGVTMAFDDRFKIHEKRKFFATYGELRRAILIRGISMEKSRFLGYFFTIKNIKNFEHKI